jgi:hypothetical protein
VDHGACRAVEPSADRIGVKAASSRCAAPDSIAAYVVTWADISGKTVWCWRSSESLFLLCSFQ